MIFMGRGEEDGGMIMLCGQQLCQAGRSREFLAQKLSHSEGARLLFEACYEKISCD